MILQRYILRELLLTFLFTFAVIMAMGLVWMTLQGLRSFEGMGVSLLGRLIPIGAGSLGPWVLPLASCSATTLVYGRLAAANEINAMRMSGIHANRIVAPAFLFGLALTAVGFAFHEYAAPAAQFSRRKLARESLMAMLRVPPPGRQRFAIGNYTLSYADYRDGRMDRPYVLAFARPQGLVAEYRAVSGSVILEPGKPPRLVLSRCSYARYDPKGNKTEISADSDLTIPIEIEEVGLSSRSLSERSLEELWQAARQAPVPRNRAQALLLYHGRYARSLAPLALVLLGIPVGIFVSRSSRMAGLGAALPPLLLYFVLLFLLQGMGENMRVPPPVAAWAPDAVLLILAAVLFRGVYRK